MNLEIADLTGASKPVTAVAEVAPVATTVMSPATAVASDSVLEPRTVTGVTPAADVTAEVVNVFVTELSAKAPPTSVTEIASAATGLPNTSVANAVIVGTVPTAVAVGTESATLYAGPAVP